MYGKYYESTFTGSMFGSGIYVHSVWGYVIANTRRDHLVELNPALLAAAIGCDVAGIETAIEHLCEPDPRSRSKKEDGRRLIRRGQFIYFVVNHEDYVALRNEEERRNQNCEAQRRHRSRHGVSCADMPSVSHGQPPSAHVDVSVDNNKGEAPSAAGAAALSPGSQRRHKYPEWFAAWWKLYVHNTGRGTEKRETFQAAQRLGPDEQGALAVVTEAWFGQRERLHQAGAFVAEAPDPIRFIRHRRWEDELSVPSNGNPNGATARPPAPTPEDLAAIDRALADSQPVAGGAQ